MGETLKSWLPFLNTYRTFCLSPSTEKRKVLDGIKALQLAA